MKINLNGSEFHIEPKKFKVLKSCKAGHRIKNRKELAEILPAISKINNLISCSGFQILKRGSLKAGNLSYILAKTEGLEKVQTSYGMKRITRFRFPEEVIKL